MSGKEAISFSLLFLSAILFVTLAGCGALDTICHHVGENESFFVASDPVNSKIYFLKEN